MKIVNAYCAAITAQVARAACFNVGEKPAFIRLHPMQLCMVVELMECTAIAAVAATLEDIEVVKNLAKTYQPLTFLGIPIEQDPTMRPDEIVFLNEEAEVVACIVNLAIPIGCEIPK